MSSYQTPDSRKEEFRKYLEKSGVIDALTKGALSVRVRACVCARGWVCVCVCVCVCVGGGLWAAARAVVR